MQKTFIRLMIAVVLAAGAWLSESEARFTRRVADAKQQIAMLRYAEVPADLEGGLTMSDYLPASRRLDNEARLAKSTVAYWLGRYDAVTPDTDDAQADADVLLTAANAAFRDAQRAPGSGPAAVQRLDGVLNAYASALKASPRSVEAAYNYEFIARYRDQIARAQGRGVKAAPRDVAMAGDLPAGSTIHGRPGAPPPEAKMEDLQMLAPLEYGDREAQPEATPGGKRERKG